jgi:Sigma-70 region 2
MVHLIEPMIPALRRYARALLRDRSAVDDLVQDCLERAIGRWHHIEDADERQLGRAAPQEDGLRYRELLMALWQLPALGPGSSGSS